MDKQKKLYHWVPELLWESLSYIQVTRWSVDLLLVMGNSFGEPSIQGTQGHFQVDCQSLADPAGVYRWAMGDPYINFGDQTRCKLFVSWMQEWKILGAPPLPHSRTVLNSFLISFSFLDSLSGPRFLWVSFCRLDTDRTLEQRPLWLGPLYIASPSTSILLLGWQYDSKNPVWHGPGALMSPWASFSAHPAVGFLPTFLSWQDIYLWVAFGFSYMSFPRKRPFLILAPGASAAPQPM